MRMASFALAFSSYSPMENKKLFLQINSWVAICCPDPTNISNVWNEFSSDKVSETIHRDKKLPLTIHLQVFSLYLETKQKKIQY